MSFLGGSDGKIIMCRICGLILGGKSERGSEAHEVFLPGEFH